MQTSESIKSISAALVGFHKEVGKVAKDSNNPFFKSKYASLSNILDAISAPLSSNGLSIVQFPEGDNGLTTRLVHDSGEWMEATYTMKPVKDDPQGRGSALTYQRRYAVGAILSLNIDADDDGNQASGKGQQQATPLKQAQNGMDWVLKVKECMTQKDLVALYNKHKAEIDTNPKVQQIIADRRNEIGKAKEVVAQ
jgi:hypothetical protein